MVNYSCATLRPRHIEPGGRVMTSTNSADLLSLPQADQEAIAGTLLSLLAGFRERDAEKLTNVYADDADWVNAFGTVKKGSEQIVEYLRGLFSSENFNSGTL